MCQWDWFRDWNFDDKPAESIFNPITIGSCKKKMKVRHHSRAPITRSHIIFLNNATGKFNSICYL